jgi:hypothetical protein
MDALKYLLTRTGARLSVNTIRLLSASVNYLEVG